MSHVISRDTDRYPTRALFAHKGAYIVARLADGTVEIRGAEAPDEVLHSIPAGPLRNRPLAVHGGRLALAADGAVELWSLAERRQIDRLDIGDGEDDEEEIQKLVFSPDGRHLVYASDYERIRVLALDSRTAVAEISAGERNPALAFSPDGTTLVNGYCFPGASAFEFRPFADGALAASPASKIRSGFDATIGAAFDPRGELFAFTDRYAHIHDRATGERRHAFDRDGSVAAEPEAEGRLESFWSNPVFSRDGERMFCAAPAGIIHGWDVATGAVVKTLELHRGRVFSLALDPDGTRLLSAGRDGQLIISTLD